MKRGFLKTFAAVMLLLCIAVPAAHYYGLALPSDTVVTSYNTIGGPPAHISSLWIDAPIKYVRPKPQPAEKKEGDKDGPAAPTLDNLPAKCKLEVPFVSQLPELPNGCEATALATVLQYYGLDANKMDVAYNYLPTHPFVGTGSGRIGGDPELVYPGDPANGSGYYCFPKPLEKAANDFLLNHDSPLIARDISGAREEEFLLLLAQGCPIIIWTTRDDRVPAPAPELAWTLEGTQERYIPYKNLHVVVLTGYDKDVFYINDPLGRHQSFMRNDLMLLYTSMNKRAMVITP